MVHNQSYVKSCEWKCAVLACLMQYCARGRDIFTLGLPYETSLSQYSVNSIEVFVTAAIDNVTIVHGMCVTSSERFQRPHGQT